LFPFEKVTVSHFKVAACFADNIGDRSEQQDRVAILTSVRHPNALLAVVADGMGGRTGGRMASDQVISTVRHIFEDMAEQDAGGLSGLLKQMASEAHTVIRLSALSSEKEPHSTMVVLIVRRRYAIWAHAGDSRLYYFRGGTLLHRTADQTYAWHLRAQGKEAEAVQADAKFRHMLVSALGLKRPPDLIINEVPRLAVGDVFLLCSDGLWTYFDDNELGTILHQMSPRDASDTLIKLARSRANGKGDNLSLAIIKLEAPEKPAA
jgi:serine/threonine protein phosphatase PrpC